MAVPSGAKIFEEPLDPYDVVDFQVDLNPLLETGESITAYTISVPTESSLLGLEVKTTDGYTTSLSSNIVQFWLGILLAEQANAAFNTSATLPIEISITTNSVPARKKQRTVAVVVKQR
jgi:hypothetical protein